MHSKYHFELQSHMSQTRFHHSLRVQAVAIELANGHNLPLQTVSLAGLLHDMAKQHTPQSLTAQGLDVAMWDDCWTRFPAVWHAFVGPALIHHVFLDVPTSIDAIVMCHTTGQAHMTPAEMVVFIADFIEPERDHSCREAIEKRAYQSLESAVAHIAYHTITTLNALGREIHPHTQACWECYASYYDGAMSES